MPHRLHPRAPLELEVVYERVNAFIADYTRDISKGGLFVRTDRPLAVGTTIQFRVKLPRRVEPLPLIGEVVWRREGVSASGGARPGMGIKFIWHEEAARRAFEAEVESLMIDTLGEPLYRKLLDKDQP